MFATKSRSCLKFALSSIAVCGAVLCWSPSAEAGASTGTWRNGMHVGPYGPGYYGRHGYYAPRRHYGVRRGHYRNYGYHGPRRYHRGYATRYPRGRRVVYYRY